MYIRRIAYLIVICLCFICYCGCSNKNIQYKEKQKLQLDKTSFSETETNIAITRDICTSTITTQASLIQTTETTSTTLTSLTTEYIEVAIAEEIEQTVEPALENIEPDVEVQENVITPNDCIIIHDTIIPIIHDVATQYVVDTNDVVQDTGYYDLAVNKILLFGHVNKSFSILNSVCTNEVITLVNSGEAKNYIVSRSELGLVNDENTDIVLSDGERTVLYTDMGYPELVLITCDDETVSRYRWVVIATEME